MNYHQKTQEFTIKIANNFSVDLNQVDAWLKDVLNITIEPLIPSQENNMTLEEEKIAHFAWRVLLLSKTLLQAIKIPIFDTGHVKKINNEDSKECVITLDIAEILTEIFFPFKNLNFPKFSQKNNKIPFIIILLKPSKTNNYTFQRIQKTNLQAKTPHFLKI